MYSPKCFCCCSVTKLCPTPDSLRPHGLQHAVASLSLYLFIQLMGFSRQVCWCGLPFHPVDDVLSELSTVTCLSWVALRDMAHSFIKLLKPLCHGKAVIHEGDQNVY